MEESTNLIAHNHSWYFEKSFSCADKYDQFINWLRVEFYFFQQDQSSDFAIYFPNGQMKVRRMEETDTTFVSKITVESKCRKFGLKIKKNLSEFLDHIEKYHNLSEISI